MSREVEPVSHVCYADFGVTADTVGFSLKARTPASLGVYKSFRLEAGTGGRRGSWLWTYEIEGERGTKFGSSSSYPKELLSGIMGNLTCPLSAVLVINELERKLDLLLDRYDKLVSQDAHWWLVRKKLEDMAEGISGFLELDYAPVD